MATATVRRLICPAVVAAGVLAVFAAPGADAKIISGNFCSVAPIADEPAGVVPVSNWNDYTSPAGFTDYETVSGSQIKYNDGSLTAGTSISWTVPNGGAQNTNDNVNRPVSPATIGNDIQDGHDQMMTGYLQASRLSRFAPIITLGATGLDLGAIGSTYSVIVYFDGDGDVENPTNSSFVSFRVWSSQASYNNSDPALATYYGEDSSDFALDHTIASSLGDYVRITSGSAANPTAGNYVQFDGLTGSSFFIVMEGLPGRDALGQTINGGGHGVALNGFQIIPEPASMALLAVGAGLLLGRRR